MDIANLQEACQILGLNYEEFVEVPSVEKGVPDYKVLYEEQKALNEKILSNIGEISKSFESKLDGFKTDLGENWKGQISELQKSLTEVKKEVDDMKNTPVRSAKSATSVHVIEKAVGQQNSVIKNASQVFSLKDPASVKELKKCLQQKMMEDLEKGVVNGCYETAALKLDAYRTIPQEVAKAIYDRDKIYIEL